jgi:hypothetical protein
MTDLNAIEKLHLVLGSLPSDDLVVELLKELT